MSHRHIVVFSHLFVTSLIKPIYTTVTNNTKTVLFNSMVAKYGTQTFVLNS
jgi:hypothetical protein